MAHPKAGQYRDYRGGLKTYPKHAGTDFNIPNFRRMDRDFAVYASAGGKVLDVRDGETDRNTSRSCSVGFGNYVKIEHPNGYTTLYGHLQNGSISVERRQDIAAGRKIGAIGSSGSSDGPHLHFELRDRYRDARDPFEKKYWITPPMYDPPFAIMDFSVQKGPIGLDEAKMAPKDNVETFSSGEPIGFGLFMSGWQVNEEIVVGFQAGNMECEGTVKIAKDRIENLTIAFGHIDVAGYCGRGTISIYRAGAVVCEQGVEVQCPS